MKLPQIALYPAPVSLHGLPDTFMTPAELRTLVHLVRSVKAERMIEIGCNSGRTAALLLRNCDHLVEYVGVDVWPGYEFDRPCQRGEVPERPGEYAAADPRFVLMLNAEGSMGVTLPDADVIFIDGDHSERAVRHDTKLARRLVRPGGMIIWHDYHDQETVDVRKVLDEDGSKRLQHIAGTWLVIEAH